MIKLCVVTVRHAYGKRPMCPNPTCWCVVSPPAARHVPRAAGVHLAAYEQVAGAGAQRAGLAALGGVALALGGEGAWSKVGSVG